LIDLLDARAAVVTFVFVVFFWIFSVCLHEFAHALAAYKGGDITVKDKGYLSLNPIHYLDPMSSIIFPVLIVILGGIGLPGAAVYIEMHRIRSVWWRSFVSLAGPLANLALLILLSIVLQFDAVATSTMAPGLAFLAFLQATAVIFNLLPVPGFDGYGVIAPFLPIPLRQTLDRFAGVSIFALLALVLFVPPVREALGFIQVLLAAIVGLPLELIGEGYRAFRFWT
jgi:Zn-dependent protease